MTPQVAVGLPEEDILKFLATRINKLDGVVLTGGEPTLQKDLPEILRKIKSMGFSTKLDSNGSKPELLKELIDRKLIDFVAMDIKAPLHKYHLLCGRTVDIRLISQSLKLISDSGIPHLFRTTYYKKLLSNDDMKEIKRLLPDKTKYVVQTYRNTN